MEFEQKIFLFHPFSGEKVSGVFLAGAASDTTVDGKNDKAASLW